MMMTMLMNSIVTDPNGTWRFMALWFNHIQWEELRDPFALSVFSFQINFRNLDSSKPGFFLFVDSSNAQTGVRRWISKAGWTVVAWLVSLRLGTWCSLFLITSISDGWGEPGDAMVCKKMSIYSNIKHHKTYFWRPLCGEVESSLWEYPGSSKPSYLGCKTR